MVITLDPQKEAVKIATRDVALLGRLFSSVGDKNHTNTPIIRGYRNAHRALAYILKTNKSLEAIKEIMLGLKETTDASISEIMDRAILAGATSAHEQIRVYGLSPPKRKPVPDKSMEEAKKAAKKIVTNKVDYQTDTILAMTMADMGGAAILGDEHRVGVLKPYDVALAAAFWIAALFWDSFDKYSRKTEGVHWYKQAVAALDERTTRTCLAVHGQIQPINGEFHLTEEPRFADYLPNPPFHYRCRTATALYLPEYDFGFTALMEDSARTIINERASGQSGFRHPADAFA